MSIYKYNWNEIARKSDHNANGIILLAYCQVIGYNKRLAWKASFLTNHLYLEYIPQILISRGLIKFTKRGIINKYKCELPQSYFRNSWFLTYRCTPNTKAAYLYILSQRNLSNFSNHIPENYIPKNLRNNLLIKQKNGKIYFTPEMVFHRITTIKRRN